MKKIQAALNRFSPLEGGPIDKLVVDGTAGRLTKEAIHRFQRKFDIKVRGTGVDDGIVDVDGLTIQRLRAGPEVQAEMAGRGVALAARVAGLQRELVAAGSGLEWLSRAGAFREPGGRHGEAADENIRHTVLRMESAPSQWIMSTNPRAAPFAVPTGAQRWQAAFEALKRDARTPLPVDLP